MGCGEGVRRHEGKGGKEADGLWRRGKEARNKQVRRHGKEARSNEVRRQRR